MNLMFLANNLLLLAGGSINGDKRPLDDSERWGVTLAGLGIVLAALVLLIVVIFIFGKIFEAISSSKQKKAAATVAAKAPKTAPKKPSAPAPVKPAAPVKVPDTVDDDEVIAVISAVVAMMSEADGTAYRVKSVKPAGSTVMSGRSAWAMDGRRQNISPF